jgi:hypothetical protein
MRFSQVGNQTTDGPDHCLALAIGFIEHSLQKLNVLG